MPFLFLLFSDHLIFALNPFSFALDGKTKLLASPGVIFA